jgi:hypothetical protein
LMSEALVSEALVSAMPGSHVAQGKRASILARFDTAF